FDQASLPVIREYYLQPEYADKLAIYTRYLTKKVSLLAQDAHSRRKPEQIAKDVKDVVAFEKQLAAILTPIEDYSTQSDLFDGGRLSDLHELVPQVNWFRYFRAVLPSIARNYINMNTTIVVQTTYFEKLSKLLKRTSARTLTNYLLLRYSEFWADDLGDEYDALEAEYAMEMTGAERQPRWKICSAAVLEGLPQAVGAMYVRYHFEQTSLAGVFDVVENVWRAFRDMVGENDWLDPKTKRHALEKVDSMEFTIGFTRTHLNDSELDRYHQGINLRPRDTFTTMKAKLASFAMLKSGQRLFRLVERTEFHASPAVANGYYDPTKNGIFLLAASLEPYVEMDLPSFYTYASLGAFVGHEIAHAFDDAGVQHDKVGNLKDWWSDESFARFTSRTECLADEYSTFLVDEIGMNLNGRLTLGENIADNVALKASFRVGR
ncbi:CRE-NEP-1 protein, partial [Aphelenchoides avenae]